MPTSVWIPLAEGARGASIPDNATVCCAVVADVLYVFNGSAGAKYDLFADTWVDLSAHVGSPLETDWSAAGAIGTKIYLAGDQGPFGGGSSPTRYLANLVVYDTLLDTYTSKANLPVARAGAGGAAANNLFAVWGGCINPGVGTAAFKFDSPGSFSCDPEDTATNVYNPLTDTWDPSWGALPAGVQHPACCSDGFYVYSIGGWVGGDSGDASVSCYRLNMNPAAGKAWQRIADLPSAAVWGVASYSKGRVWLYGAHGPKSTGKLNAGYVYDITANKWSSFGSPYAVNVTQTTGYTAGASFNGYGGVRSDGVLVLPTRTGLTSVEGFYGVPAPHLPTFRYQREWASILQTAVTS